MAWKLLFEEDYAKESKQDICQQEEISKKTFLAKAKLKKYFLFTFEKIVVGRNYQNKIVSTSNTLLN